jgi:excinuclease ABC subunit C
MTAAAEKEDYEEAARFRDLIGAVEVTLEKQKMVVTEGEFDLIGYHREGDSFETVILFMRGGKVIGSKGYSLGWELDDAEGLASFLREYYSRDIHIPAEILLPLAIPESESFAELLTERLGKKVVIATPRRGVKKGLVDLAMKNAATVAEDKRRSRSLKEDILEELRTRLNLGVVPRRIECYDISNIQGRHAVGSRVVFINGLADKGLYRRYRIKTVDGADDFAMMREVLSRRFAPDRDDGVPDLIVVDGGVGQLNVLVGVLSELNVDGVAAVGLAKSRVEKGMAREEIERSAERIFLPGRKNPLVLRQNSAPLLLLASIRDEAHRLAITYHKKVRSDEAMTSAIAAVPGIGEKGMKKLLTRFGSLRKLAEATLQEITEVKGISAKTTEKVWNYLHGDG